MRGTTLTTTADDFVINISNGTPLEAKVKKFEYKDDDGDWNTENFLGVDGIHKIGPGHWFSWTRNLRGIGGKSTQFRVTYSLQVRGEPWSDDRVAYSEIFVAHDGEGRIVNLH
jgi:hypothetical protein